MSLISRNVFRALFQGSQHVGKGVHTSAVNADKNVCLAPHSISTLQSQVTKEGRIKCTLIPGDGVGPELVYSVQEVFKAASIPVDFESFFFSEVNPTLSAPLEDVVNSISKNKICIKGILATPDFSHTGELQTLNMKLRNALDLFANVVHVKSLPNVKCRHSNVDCIIIREQTEGEYSALEHESVPGVVECLKIITAKKSERIAKFAFDYAVKMGRKKVTAVHKANIMKLGDGLFLRCCEDMAKLYPRIQFEKMIVDNCTMQMVSNPNQFDVMVTPNLYGNIVDNLASGLVGGAGVVAGASYSAECAVFEQGARHIFSGAVGKNIANPTAMLLCSANMLAHVNLHSYSKMMKNAINKVLMDGKVRTKDLGGQNTTKDFTNAVIHSLDH
ncbi:isocitrate dehydrogenase [NAD] subunit beta, mitochondrial [Ostrinia nubilalis]|uniref:isocitrate dehydrogenase [NAD] subunit beta, mitochondrial n=2 Tax=Ostrinia TaxID=29056 RepID=UPI0010387836|nr:isocitrate dehydrogenase [NAD] subunit beta, mitochondrial isoform X1 [Ostrinia furnacalis]XP_028165010.1 isocitrate dehydrogenase [NAD] subunit beta, mitochondrial isoform X5 [Ostrinia furnacalis]